MTLEEIDLIFGFPSIECRHCDSTGIIEGKDYPDGSYSSDRICPHCERARDTLERKNAYIKDLTRS